MWRREYAAEPQASVLGAFNPDLIERAFRPAPKGYAQCPRVLLLDPTAGSSDTYAWGVAGWRYPREGQEGEPLLVVDEVTGIDQASARGFTSKAMIAGVVGWARMYRCVAIHSDQFERFSLASAFGEQGYPFYPHTWTAPMKEAAVQRVRQWLRDGTLVLPRHERLRRELLSFEEKFSPTGALTFRGRQGGHDDFAMLIVLAGIVDIGRGLSGSPLYEAQIRARREQLRQSLESFELALYGDEKDYARHEAKLAEQTRVRLNDARAQTTQSPDWPERERLEWNLVRYHQGSTPLKEEELAELREHGLIPPLPEDDEKGEKK